VIDNLAKRVIESFIGMVNEGNRWIRASIIAIPILLLLLMLANFAITFLFLVRYML
jgi:hypothetical protein